MWPSSINKYWLPFTQIDEQAIFVRFINHSFTFYEWFASIQLAWLFTEFTHWGRVTHICVTNLTTIGSDNGLSPGRRQAIIWTNAGTFSIVPLGTRHLAEKCWVRPYRPLTKTDENIYKLNAFYLITMFAQIQMAIGDIFIEHWSRDDALILF